MVLKQVRAGLWSSWKETPVIGGKVGGIRHQIKDGEKGFLVSSIEEAAKRIVQLVKDRGLNK